MSRGPSEPRRRRRGRGITLLEALIGSVLFSVVIVGVYMLYTTMQSTMSRGELKADLQQNARIGLNRMVQEIRMAGYDPSGAIPQVVVQPKAALRAATPGCLAFIAYSPDRSTTPPTEKSVQITYDRSGTRLRRKEGPWNAGSNTFSGGAGAQPLAESVDLLSFIYYDMGNNLVAPTTLSTTPCPPGESPLSSAIAQLTLWELRQVRRIGITLRTRDSRPGILPEFYTLTADVHLRNR